jgi:hypothetical protein
LADIAPRRLSGHYLLYFSEFGGAMDDAIYEVARLIRPYLPKLVGSAAEAVDGELAALLARVAAGEDAGREIASVLSQYPAAHAWAAQALSDARRLPPDLQRTHERGFQPLPGDGDVVDMEKYACRYGDFVWWRVFLDDDPPQCPTHGRIYRAY